MERIILEVNSELAKAWRNSPIKLREQLEKEFELRAADQIRKSNESNFETELDNLRKEAESNGLTPEILENLLNEEK